MRIPRAIEKVIEGFERLPGIGPKSAQRLGFYLLHVPQESLNEFAAALSNLKKEISICKNCFNIGNTELCEICSDDKRDESFICVVEDSLDVVSIEKSGKFTGVYHVLHGLVDPLNSIGPEDIYIPQLLARLKNNGTNIKEILIATNPTMEGEATAMYIHKQVKSQNPKVKITRIGRGLPIGADIEYADETTISRALEGRQEF